MKRSWVGCGMLMVCAAGLLASGENPGHREYRIDGRILQKPWPDSVARIPISDAWVAVSALRTGTYTDIAGRFTLDVHGQPRCYRLNAVYIAHQPTWHDFALGKATTVHLGDLLLEPSAIPEVYPNRSGACIPADSTVSVWPGAFGLADVTIVVPNGLDMDSIWLTADGSCRQGLPLEGPVLPRARDNRYRVPIGISAQRLLPPHDDRERGRVVCRLMAWTNTQLSGYIDVPVRIGKRAIDAPKTPVRLEIGARRP